jgi:hypothetical protein
MIKLTNADSFIRKFEIYGRKISRIPLTYFNGRKVNILMCKCGRRWICLPMMSEGVLETEGLEISNPPFALFESEDGNICATRNVRWEIRDTRVCSNFIYSEKVNFRIKLKDLETPLINIFPSNIRRKTRKASSNGLILKSGGKQYLKHFYRIYSHRMHTIGACPCGKSYIRKRLICGDYTLFIVYYQNKPIGAASLMRHNAEIMENEFFATATEFNHLYPSYLLHYGMMKFAMDNNCDYLLGRSTYESSVYEYKQHFKAEQYYLFWSYSHRTRNIRNIGFLKKLWKALPYRLMLFISPFVYQRIY